MDKFVIYAHRGASEYYPENTLSSFAAGVDMGANGIETDVQISKDGVLMIYHDDTMTASMLCGYEQFSTFYRNFKEIMGLAPSHYQRSVRTQ